MVYPPVNSIEICIHGLPFHQYERATWTVADAVSRPAAAMEIVAPVEVSMLLAADAVDTTGSLNSPPASVGNFFDKLTSTITTPKRLAVICRVANHPNLAKARSRWVFID